MSCLQTSVAPSCSVRLQSRLSGLEQHIRLSFSESIGHPSKYATADMAEVIVFGAHVGISTILNSHARHLSSFHYCCSAIAVSTAPPSDCLRRSDHQTGMQLLQPLRPKEPTKQEKMDKGIQLGKSGATGALPDNLLNGQLPLSASTRATVRTVE